MNIHIFYKTTTFWGLLSLILLSNNLYGKHNIHYHKIELFSSSKDIDKGGIIYDSATCEANESLGKVVINTPGDKKYFYKINSIWGIKTSDKYFRIHSSNFGYFFEKLTFSPVPIYRTTGGKHGDSYYFSNTLDSGLIPLTDKNAKKMFKDKWQAMIDLAKELSKQIDKGDTANHNQPVLIQ
jgi:hypothetical protein